jgi:hypothetical protein
LCHLCLLCCTQILKELEGLHLSAAEQLEGLYEARLALEKERLKQLAAAKDDIELSLKVGSTTQTTSGHLTNHVTTQPLQY